MPLHQSDTAAGNMATPSPTKRRPLASLDVNAQPRLSSTVKAPMKSPASKMAVAKTFVPALPTPSKQMHRVPSQSGSPSPSPASASQSACASPHRKRSLPSTADGEEQPAAKKLCSEACVPASPPATEKRRKTPPPTPQERQPKVEEDAQEHTRPTASQQTTTTKRSMSPEASSIFDVSVIDTSQATTVTIPDTPPHARAGNPAVAGLAASASPRRPRQKPTIEELKREMDMLRTRLRYARYKVETGQADVPLDRLQVRPLRGFGRSRRHALPLLLPPVSAAASELIRLRRLPPTFQRGNTAPPCPASPRLQAHRSSVAQAEPPRRDNEDDGCEVIPSSLPEADESVAPELPSRPPAASAVMTPRRKRFDDDEQEKLTSSALRDGVAKGLLSLARG